MRAAGTDPVNGLVADRACREVSPLEALALMAEGVPLLDLREPAERAAAMAAGALAVIADDLPHWLRQQSPPRALLICARGVRSRHALERLQAPGRELYSVRGGMAAWLAAGLPLAGGPLDADARQRYARQLALPQVGTAGQARLAQACVALVGVGGLGAPAALYLAAAGVGRITLIDPDRVERSNLQRQVLYADAETGLAKVEAAAQRLTALNPRVRVQAHAQRLDAGNAARLLAGHDLVLDGADNFPARYALAAASIDLGLPMIYAAVERFGGHLSVFDPRRADSPCYRCLFPEPPVPDEVPTCAEAGVLGVTPGVLGMLQAAEALKLLLGIGELLVGRLLQVDVLGGRVREAALPRDPECPGCGPRRRPADTQPRQPACSAGGSTAAADDR